MITYETIKNIHDEERLSKGLVKLPDNFFQQARLYLDRKAGMVRDEKDKWELESAKKRLEAIIELRERKIVIAALYYDKSGFEPENLTDKEKTFFNEIVSVVKNYHEQLKNLTKDGDEKSLLMIEGNVPKFVGINMKNYGSFRFGDIALLPKENADLLVEKGMAREIKCK
ncbi:MAG TPA: DNA replication complex GINS family protein [Candidatus Aenigmarchaeota archaeon]|nr:MAG: hypothetical protein DRP03_03520 [Candidatus Aenigmarchaeota archaeon]HDD46271.1 DNA replication complex GINS family protein [Candidatus Aenigmarchaeota archaeon]